MGAEELIGYEELAALTGRSTGALRVARSKGRLPEPDAPGPRWRRESLAAFLKEGSKVSAGGPSVAQEPRSGAPASPATPEAPTPLLAAPAPPRPAFEGDDPEDRRRRSMTLVEILECVHPLDDRKVLPYMTICVVCGRRQEGRDRWSGAGYASWSKEKLAACPHPAAERIQHAFAAQCGVCGRLLRG